MKKFINWLKVIVLSYFAWIGAIWVLVEPLTFFEGDNLKKAFGGYGFLLYYIPPLIFSIGWQLYKNYKARKAQSTLASADLAVLLQVRKNIVDGVVARMEHFKHIGDEGFVRQRISELINKRYIDAGLGSIIQLLPDGEQALRERGN
jgi:hypothetical protein